MTRFSSYLLCLLTLTGLFTSCTERIDIDLDSSYQRLVVDGRITRRPELQYVLLTRTADYFVNELPTGVSHANVRVDDGDQVYTFAEDSLIAGLYKPATPFAGVIGKNYHLEINLAEAIGGNTYFEANERMPLVSDDIDSVRVEYNFDFEIWFAGIYANEPPRTDFYMFNGMCNGTMLTDSLWRISLSDDRLFNGNPTNGTIVQVLQKDELKAGDIFTLILSNITEQYYNYLIEAQTEINPKNPLFSGPPANVSSNVSGGAVGYFAAFPSEFVSTTVKLPKEE